MNDMDYIMLLQSLGLTPLNIVLVVMVYFMGTTAGIFPKFWKLKGAETEAEETTEETPKWAQELKEHFNDTTTNLLTRIASGVEKLDTKQATMCQKLDTIKGILENIKEDDSEWRQEQRTTMREILRK